MNKTSKTTFNAAILVPIYNHWHTLATTIEQASATGYPIILIDDGSNIECKNEITRIVSEERNVSVITRKTNGGKGAAVKTGLDWAEQHGYTHCLQVDADGQHCIDDVSKFMNTAKVMPSNLVCGYPVYDKSIPKLRLYARYLTHIWVWINTLSFELKDSMCGYRVYPTNAVNLLIQKEKVGDRMDFDTEILVRWVWQGGHVKQLPTRVTYPLDGVSHFRLFRDNLLITLMHTRLFFGMLIRIPKILSLR